MTTALQTIRWRRALALGAASLMLHYLVIGWGSAPLHAPAPRSPSKPLAIVAELRAAPMPEPAIETRAAVPLPQVQLQSSQARPRPAAPPRPHYRASAPPPAQLTFDVVRADAQGTLAGQTVMDWRAGQGRYRLDTVTELDGSVLLALASEGALVAGGIVPRSLSAQRRGKARTATHFDAQRGSITFSAAEGSVAMAPGTQDKATWPLQLAAIARADAGQLKAGIDLPVGEEKDAATWHFVLVGQEQIETGMGRLATWHLSCQPAAGSYRPGLDVWLAAGHSWYPVQLRSTEASGAITTQTIRKIVAQQAGN